MNQREAALQRAQAERPHLVKTPIPPDPRTVWLNRQKAAVQAQAAERMSSHMQTKPDILHQESAAIAADTSIEQPQSVPEQQNDPLPAVLLADAEVVLDESSERNQNQAMAVDVALAELLSDAQWKAIFTLLEGKPIKITAEICGTDERTLRTWLQIPEFDRQYKIGCQQNADFVNTLLQAAAVDAALTLVELAKSENQSIKVRASRAIVQLANAPASNAKIQKAQVELEVAKARQDDQIKEFQQAKGMLTQRANNWEKIKTALTQGTFRRPAWLPAQAWEQIIKSQYSTSAAW